MGRPPKANKNKDMHISLDFKLYTRLMNYLELNKSIGKSELLCRIIDDFLKKQNF